MQKYLQLEMDKIDFLARRLGSDSIAKKFHGVDHILVIALEGDGRQQRLLEQAEMCGVLEKITLFTAIHNNTWSNPDSDFKKYGYKSTEMPEGAKVSESGLFWTLEPNGDCQVRRAGVFLTSVYAITHEKCFQTRVNSRKHKHDNRKEVACCISHMLTIKFAEEMKYCPLMVVESDGFFLAAVYWKFNLGEVMNAAPGGWGCISLNNTMLGRNALFGRPFLPWNEHLQWDGKTCWGTQCVLYSEAGIKLMTEYFDTSSSTVKLNCTTLNQRELDVPNFDGLVSRIRNALDSNLVCLPSDQTNVGMAPMHPKHDKFHGKASLDLLLRFSKMREEAVST